MAQVTLEKDRHILVFDRNGFVTEDEQGMWPVMDLTTHNIFYVAPTEEVISFFEIVNQHHQDTPIESVPVTVANENVQSSCSGGETNDSRCPWTKNDILNLIHLYQKYSNSFKSTTIKNDKVWQWIATDIKTHTAIQCKNKFKYLKAKYIEKKDNMSTRKTGEKAIRFEYFTEFDDIFGNEPNVQPISIASSSRGEDNILPSENKNEGEDASNPKKRKRSILEKQLTKYEENLKEREEAKERRHIEVLQRQDQAINIFNNLAESFKTWVDK